ncbi:MAG TPA: lipopolysaccharide kinase InaA family protein [Candidatus Binatia bacterium]|nr:lipopolysaccharide kinase InaA family protein [Candidatus Binatia bacterium]
MHRQPEFVLEKRGALFIQVVGTLAQDLLPEIGDPDHFFGLPGCEIVKDQRKIKVARIKIEIQGDKRTAYLKRYNAFSWRYRFGSLFRSSGALRSLKGAAILAESGIRTARPLAAVDSRSWGMLSRSFFLSEEIENGKTVDLYWREELLTIKGKEGLRRRRRFLRGMGELFDSLHRQAIYHNDLKDANILVRPDSNGSSEHFYLLDLEGIRRYQKLSWRRRVKNLVQLNRTLGQYLGATDKLRLLESYLGVSFLNRDEKRRWVSKVLKQSRRIDRLRQSQAGSRAQLEQE